ncbi:MAG: hypothetical protein ABFE02_16680 [Sulfuricella sp.]
MNRHLTLTRAAVLAGAGWACLALAEAPPASEQEVVNMFTQREHQRSEQLLLRSYTAPLISPVFDAHTLERQLRQSQWWLQHRSGPIPYCQPPYFIPSSPFGQCPNFPLH